MDFDNVMKNVGNKLNDVRDVMIDLADKASKKANEVYGDAKLKLKLADIQRDINSLYKEIGSAAYTAKRSGEDIAAVIADKCDEVERLYAEMEELAKKAEEAEPDDDAVYVDVADDDADDDDNEVVIVVDDDDDAAEVDSENNSDTKTQE